MTRKLLPTIKESICEQSEAGHKYNIVKTFDCHDAMWYFWTRCRKCQRIRLFNINEKRQFTWEEYGY